MRRRMSAWGLIGQTPHHQEPLLRSRSKKRNTMVDVVKVEATCKSSLDTISADLSQGLLGELECPVCMEYMLPPITFCLNGHNICQNCKPQLSNCPTCRQPFVNIRNVALEKLARQMKYPCTFRKYGCKEKFSPGQIASHHASCRFSPQVCPLEKLRKVKCDWTGSVGEIKKHLKDEHKEQCLEYTGRHSLVLCGVKPTCGYFRVIFAHNEIFYRHFQIRNGALYATLQYIGPSENAAKFR
ncbi:hypothetical protein C0J52_20427 [Blattella germanica]|nr:hypothetical protein C0J52_20427 [Blattella germanica]